MCMCVCREAVVDHAPFSFHVDELPEIHITWKKKKEKKGESGSLMLADGMLRPNATFPGSYNIDF